MRYIILIFSYCFLILSVKGQPFGSSIMLNGNNDYFTVPDNNSLDQSISITLEAWINPCKVSDNNFVISKLFCAGSQDAYYLNVKNGKLVWHWDTDGNCGNTPGIYESVNPVVDPNKWQHVAVVHTDTGVSLYYNGSIVNATLVSGSFGTINNSLEPLRIGSYKSINGTLVGYFKGQIDDFRIWNYALSSDEIQSRMSMPLNGNESALIAYYNMDIIGAGQGITILNKAIITGTINNGTTVGTSNTPLFISETKNIFNFDLGNDTILCEGQIKNLAPIVPNASYLWQDNSTAPTFNVSKQGVYWVEITLNECSSRDSIYIQQKNCESNLSIPNVFTPNFDGSNDFFIVEGDGIASLKTKIFNRWGSLIFESDSLNKNWNGKTTIGTESSEGIYFYIITVESNFKIETFYGSFALMR